MNPLIVVDFRFISTFLLAQQALNSHVKSLWNFCRLSFLEFDRNVFTEILSIQRCFSLTKYWQVCCQKFTAHCDCRNADFSLILVEATSDRFIFQIINSLMKSWGVRLTWLDCNWDKFLLKGNIQNHNITRKWFYQNYNPFISKYQKITCSVRKTHTEQAITKIPIIYTTKGCQILKIAF